MPACNGSVRAADAQGVRAAARILAAGGIVVYPTETLYGLGVDARNAEALGRLVALKGREPGKPIAVLVTGVPMLGEMVEEISPQAAVLMRRFWPGPLTIVLRARPSVSALLTGGSGTIGVRCSSHAVATTLVRALGRPVTAPSANPSGCQPPRRVEEAQAYFGAGVDAYLNAGCLPGEPASTVVDARGELRVLRAGAISATALRAGLSGAA
jgi:L-threonylcarbamoyladenylate synthase